MALPNFSTGADQQQQSSLRAAVDRILGFAPGGGQTGGGGQALPQSSIVSGGAREPSAAGSLSDVSIGALPTDVSGYKNLATFSASGAGTEAPGGSTIAFTPRKSFASFLGDYGPRSIPARALLTFPRGPCQLRHRLPVLLLLLPLPPRQPPPPRQPTSHPLVRRFRQPPSSGTRSIMMRWPSLVVIPKVISIW